MHDPAEDACAAMDIYKMVRETWEKEVDRQRGSASMMIRIKARRGNKNKG